MLKLPPLSLYIHIPWCVQKCPYCDFNSHTLKGEVPHQEYVQHLLNDLDADLTHVGSREVQTIFIGGGTPSLLSAESMADLLYGVKERIAVAPDAEITMEANPGTVEAERFAGFQRAGINRISIGVQSFGNDKLIRLGRIHDADEAKNAARLAKELGLRSFNLDLMHGLPDQSLSQALSDLQQAIALSPPHLSWYQLTIEPNTQFGSRPPKLPDDDMLWDIFSEGDKLLTAAGYQQYEIMRTVKTKHPKGFMAGRYLHQQNWVDNDDRPFEFFMNRFRLLEAFPRQDFSDYTGLAQETIRRQIDEALALGYISETETHWQITPHGKLFLNSLLELFL
ncbi:radical SAM family heme chaperone HemW [Proteus mirabilis]|uniref:radical SAM family heme chaperone HemW n=1 Tax=Proteus mirabilis TaxID=584 RepID=UPI003D07A489